MGVTLSRSMNAKEPSREAPDKTTGGVLPANGRLVDQPAVQAAAAAPGETNRRRLTDAGEWK
jgi:hypothetical protein